MGPTFQNMMKRHQLSDDDLVYQIQTHLLYELRWLIYASYTFQKSNDVPFLDSAAVHARNLLEWASDKHPTRFSLGALKGRTVELKDWERWLNNRVNHMTYRETEKARWPKGGGAWGNPDKLMNMARVVLDRLRDGCNGMPDGRVRKSYEAVLDAAEAYWKQPTETNCRALMAFYDSRRDKPYPE